jgi:putative hemolysin
LMARPVGVMATIFRPLVALLTASTNLVLRLLRVPATTEPTVTEEEIRALVEEGTETGVVQPAEQEIVERAFRLGDLTVVSVMTPRTEMEWIDITDPPEVIRTELAAARLAHYVVCEGSVEKVIGIAHVEDLVAKAIAGAPIEIPADLRTVLHRPIFVPDSMPFFRLLEQFRRVREQVAIVLDEYGGVAGLATLDHILETLVGDYAEQASGEEPSIMQREDGTWLVDGVVPVDELEARLDLEPLPADDRRGFRTVAGFIMNRLGHVPTPGEFVEWGDARFEVVDMDGRRIDKVLVSRLKRRTEEAANGRTFT